VTVSPSQKMYKNNRTEPKLPGRTKGKARGGNAKNNLGPGDSVYQWGADTWAANKTSGKKRLFNQQESDQEGRL